MMCDLPTHPLWDVFWTWAETNGCDSEYEEDWGPWWNCFLAGIKAAEAAGRSIENDHA